LQLVKKFKFKNMKFIAEVVVMPHKELLDPQGKTVNHSLNSMGLSAISDVRIGKHMRIALEAENEAQAREQVETACKQVLHNAVMENYSFTLTETN
jgi:phosphoribosylformylglycinamidine synthase